MRRIPMTIWLIILASTSAYLIERAGWPVLAELFVWVSATGIAIYLLWGSVEAMIQDLRSGF